MDDKFKSKLFDIGNKSDRFMTVKLVLEEKVLNIKCANASQVLCEEKG